MSFCKNSHVLTCYQRLVLLWDWKSGPCIYLSLIVFWLSQQFERRIWEAPWIPLVETGSWCFSGCALTIYGHFYWNQHPILTLEARVEVWGLALQCGFCPISMELHMNQLRRWEWNFRNNCTININMHYMYMGITLPFLSITWKWYWEINIIIVSTLQMRKLR